MAAYCDGSAGWASLLCLPVLLAGWFLGRRLRSRAVFLAAWAIAVALALIPLAAAQLWHQPSI